MYTLPTTQSLQKKAVDYLRDLADKIENNQALVERVEGVKTFLNFGCAREEISIHILTADDEENK